MLLYHHVLIVNMNKIRRLDLHQLQPRDLIQAQSKGLGKPSVEDVPCCKECLGIDLVWDGRVHYVCQTRLPVIRKESLFSVHLPMELEKL